MTAWEVAGALYTSHDYGSPPPPPPPDDATVTRPLVEWLALVDGLYDRAAVAASPAEVIDGRLTILGLARIDEEFGAALRAAGVRRRLLRDLRFPVERVLLPWALPAAGVEALDLWTLQHGAPLLSCVFSPDGSLLATAGADGTARLWNLESGDERSLLQGHEGVVRRCEFSPDGTLLATVAQDGIARIWLADSGRLRASLTGHEGEIRQCAFSPDGALLATAGEDGTARLWDVSTGEAVETLRGHEGPLWRCAFSPDGSLLATASEDGTARLWDVASRSEQATLRGHEAHVLYCAFSDKGNLLATAGGDGLVLLWNLADSPAPTSPQVLPAHGGAVWHCAFSPDGRLLATAGADGTARLWDVDTGTSRATVRGDEDFIQRCSFAPGGRLLATAGGDGTARLWDVASGAPRAVLRGHTGAVRRCEFSRDGRRIATASEDGTARVWEPVGPPGSLPGVAPDSLEGDDRLGIGRDAAALANVIAADKTQPPLCIGLFGDWGSGKSFLIRQVQTLVRDHARRARLTSRSAYCKHIRNIEFNAWHYADANLWASLVTRLFDELAKPEPQSGLSEETARAQAARLNEQLAASSALVHRLEQAQAHVQRVEALKGLLRWTSNLAGEPEGLRDLGQVRQDASSAAGLFRLVLPNTRSRVIVAVVALAATAAVAVPLALVGVSGVQAFLASAGAFVAAAAGLIGTAMARVRRFLGQVGEVAKVAEVRRAGIDEELTAARSREQELRQELSDLAAGKRLARFVSERSEAADYRSQLGIVSRIHDDFSRMSDILAAQRKRVAEAPPGGNGEAAGAAPAAEEADLPVVDRIVLYIDDLDRCPPRRVVEVLEAVHLILALPLFVVVVAVDPRWLLQSLRLHYAELLSEVRADARERLAAARVASRNGPADAPAAPGAGPDGVDTAEIWESTPLHYLEKIFQIPFALRPVSEAGVASLVSELLPIETAAATSATSAPTDDTESPEQAAVPTGEAGPELGAPAEVSGAVRPTLRPSLSPRSLALTYDERDFAARAAGVLDTPRAVKKFTNLYRLVRAGLDADSGELDAFLDAEGGDIPEYQAVLILLAVIIAFPDEASEFLRSLEGHLPALTRDDRSWPELVQSLSAKGEGWERLAAYLTEMTGIARSGTASTREPFRRWAVEVSRYSFTTGQEIFAQFHAAASLTEAQPAAEAPR